MKRIKSKKFSILLASLFLFLGINALQLFANETQGVSNTESNNAVITIGEQEFDNFQAAIENAKNGDTLKLVNGPLTVQNAIKVPAEKNLTIDLNDQVLISSLDSKKERSLFYVNGDGEFTIKKGTIKAEDRDNDGFTGRAIYSYGASLNVDNIVANEFKSDSAGGVINVEEKNNSIKISITNNKFIGNSAKESGGAIKISTNSQDAVTLISNNVISENNVNAGTYSFGGGVSFAGKGKLEILNNNISSNSSSVNETTYGLYWSHGGGLSIDSNFNDTKSNLHVVLDGNTISNNKTQLFGGGIYFFLAQKNGDKVDLRSGVFTDNHSDFSGGAIDYSVHGQPTLELKNFIMTANEAPTGAGIWACPTAIVDSHSTLGGAVVGNKIIEVEAYPGFLPSGRDIAFEGSDTKLSSIKANNNPAVNRVTVVDRTFLGDKVTWYADDRDNLFEPGDKPIDIKDYTDRETSFGLHGELNSEDWYAKHKEQAALIFENNTARVRGGAISTNSQIQIGEPGDLSLKVNKKWLDSEGNELDSVLPEEIKVQLIRIAENGSKHELEVVSLSQENNWKHTFKNLPAKAWLDGKVQKLEYSIKELPIPGFTSEITGDAQEGFTIINKKEPEETTSTSSSTTVTTSTTTTTSTTATTKTSSTTSTTVGTTKPSSVKTSTTATTSPTTPGKDIPETGEKINMGLMVVAPAFSFVTAFVLLVIRKKREN